MKSFIRFFAERHLLANLITFMIILLGIFSLMKIKRDMYPSVDLDTVIITTRYPGASPKDVELNVTNKIEDEIKVIDGVDKLTSYSMENISVINIEIDPDAKDKNEVKRDIRDGISRVSDFPLEVTDAPYINEVKSENFEILWIGMSGDLPYSEMRQLARIFEKQLKQIKGISRVNKTGYLAREIKVEVSGEAIEEYQVPMREIVSAIQLRNVRATGGSFESYTSDKTIVALAQFEEPLEVGDVIVRSTFEGHQIAINDLAYISDDFEPEKTRFRMNGKPVIAFTIYKKESADIIRLIDEIKKFVDSEKQFLPEEVELMYSSDESRYVKARIGVLTNNGLMGLGLVIVVLFLFLNLRTAFWVAMGIPLSLMGVFFLSPFFGVHIDIVSLMGLILVIGLIVDDGIVVAESIAKRQEEGDSPVDAAVNGAYGVLRPVFATIVTTIIAFSPFFFMSGMMGKFMFPIPVIVILALLISLAEVFIIMPAHITAGRSRKNYKTSRQWFDVVKNRFQRFIVYVLKLRYIVVPIFMISLIGAFLYAANYMQFVLFPSNTAEAFFVTVELPTGSSLDATSDKVSEIETLINNLPEGELDSYWTIIGSLGGGQWFTPGESENWAFMAVTLSPFSKRNRNADEIVEALRVKTDALSDIDAINFLTDSGPPVGRPIALRVVGNDDQMRKALADSVVAFLNSMEGVTDINRDDKLGKDQVEIKIDYPRLSQFGLTVADVAQAVRLAYDGYVVSRVRYGDEDVHFRVLLEEDIRKRPEYLGELKIPNLQGRLIPLKEVAEFITGPGPSSFFHYDAERAISISADLAKNSDLTPLEATNAVIDNYNITRDWPGMRFVMGGEAEETQESMMSLAIAFGLAGLGIYIVLILLFNSITQPALVMFAIPFGMVGVVGAFALHGEPLGFMAMLGVIGMMGVVVNDSLILVNFINAHRKEDPDKKFIRIVAEGTSSRLRPIILTSVTTIVGLMPTAYGFGGDDPFIAVMALALGYGILFATPLTLLLLPCLYMIQHDIGKLVRRIPGLRHFYFIQDSSGVMVEN
ncbi:efflux RND transporter permease subunit [Candidatus Neomarinimicrobiota bacterium]